MELIRQLWYILSLRQRIEGSILLCAMALGALFEAISIGLVVPFIAVLKDPGLILNAPAAQPWLSLLKVHEPRGMLVAVGLGLVGAFVIKGGYLLLLYRWLFRYVFDLHVTLTRRLLSSYLSAPYAFHLQRNSAELIKASVQTIQRFTSGFLVSLLTVLGELFVVAALVALLMVVHPLATFAAVLALGLPTALVYRSMQRQLAGAGQLAERSMSSLIQWTEQAISGIKETLIMDRAPFFIERQATEARQFANAMRDAMLLSNVPRLIIDSFAVAALVAIALATLLGGHDLDSLVPVLAMFAVAAIRLMPSASRIAAGLAGLRFHHAATQVLYDELRETQDGALGGAGAASADQRAALPLPFKHSLVLEGLSYRYPGAARLAIDDVSLKIRRGQWVAVIGPTGAGKTTLVDLILGLFVPTSGRILVDDHDLQDHVTGWQRSIGYLPQTLYLMDDTVRRNVGFGLPDLDIDDELVWQALRAAQIENFVRSLPNGLDAVVGERGARLSGGERQRLGIARALYRDPEVLVVDEATANLDRTTEAAIVDTLTKLRGEKTIIVIAHSQPLVRNCDQIFLLREGRLRNSGVYSDLFSTDPAFREFAGSAS